MTATVAQLGARALRKLGVAIVANAGRPSAGPAMTASDVAGRVLRQLGIVTAEAERPLLTVTVTPDNIAARVLRAVGINPIAGSAASGSVSKTEIAARALRALGVNPADLGAVFVGSTFTRAQAGREVLLKLAVIDPSEAVDTNDQAEAELKISAIHDALTALDYVAWGVDVIPQRALEWYVVMAANMGAPLWGKTPNLDAYNAAQDALRIQALSGDTAQARAEGRVSSVHALLVADGLADWTDTTIPIEATEQYVAMVSQMLAPVHGRPPDMAAYDAAEARVRRVVLSGARGQALALAKVSAVQDRLVAAGIVPWPLTGIPQAYAEEYVAMAATMIAPVMGRAHGPADRQADATEQDAAEGRIRRGVMIVGMQDRAVAKVRAAHDELNGMGLVTWDINAIPSSMTDAYVGLVTAMVGPDMGRAMDPKEVSASWARIRRIAMGGPAGQALAEQKIIAVHSSLDARGQVLWSLRDLPDYAEEPYVLLAAALLAPEVDAKADPMWGPMAERTLAQVTSLASQYHPVAGYYY